MKNEKILLFTIAALVIFSGCKKDEEPETITTPTYAASKNVWKFGDQIWSDAIQIPDCNKSSFEISSTVPQCCSYTYEGNTYYYYNWAYVHEYKKILCPGKIWRVPSRANA
jgi:hypothetical protein